VRRMNIYIIYIKLVAAIRNYKWKILATIAEDKLEHFFLKATLYALIVFVMLSLTSIITYQGGVLVRAQIYQKKKNTYSSNKKCRKPIPVKHTNINQYTLYASTKK
jgi:hypothetical protein